MGRIRQMIRVNGRESWTLFDSGARNSYVIPQVAAHLATVDLPQPTYTKLGGETKVSERAAVLVGEVAGKPFHTEAMVIDSIGTDEDGRPIEVLFGALAMHQWGIRLIPDREELDLSHYPSEFVEFWVVARSWRCRGALYPPSTRATRATDPAPALGMSPTHAMLLPSFPVGETEIGSTRFR